MYNMIAERYEIIDLIGQGGMADVYLASDTILKRTVAIKILRTSLAKDPVHVARFQREASAAASLSQKNIVEIYDVGEDGNKYYIVMEYVPGTTLKELIHRRGALHYVEAIDILKQVCSGVARAHQMGIIHRDLKPQNILVTDSGIAKIADFGIASIQNLAQVTQTDVIMGSLHYLAPELARGQKATAQSDVYALGIVLYELLRGEVPFQGESPVNIAMKHMREEIPSIRSFNYVIPQSVENIIIKATAKNTNNRYSSASAMLEDIEACLDNPNQQKITFELEEDFGGETIVSDMAEIKEESSPVKNSGFSNLLQKIKQLPLLVKGGVLGFAVIMILLIGYLFISGQKQTMPDLKGMTKEQAIETLKSYNLEVSDTLNKELSVEYEKDVIIKTYPEAGKAIKKGDKVTLTVSEGKYIIVGDYEGMSYEKAEAALKQLGFVVTKELETSKEPVGTVIGQSLEKDYKQDPNQEDPHITLTVSKGDYIIIENHVGTNVDVAKAKLETFGFKVNITEVDDSQAKGTVISQSLRPGFKFDPGAKKEITLTVSKGYKVIVPNVLNTNVSIATNTLKQMGFNVQLKVLDASANHMNDASKVNIVQEQSISPGTEVNEKNKTIILSYYNSVSNGASD